MVGEKIYRGAKINQGEQGGFNGGQGEGWFSFWEKYYVHTSPFRHIPLPPLPPAKFGNTPLRGDLPRPYTVLAENRKYLFNVLGFFW